MGDVWRAVGGDEIYSARDFVSRTFTVLHIDQAFAPSLCFYVIVNLRVEVLGKDANTYQRPTF
jgi:hypothetical protein